MSKKVIGVGSAANDGLGDPDRDAFIKCNDNFTELYDMLLSRAQVANKYYYAAPYGALNASTASQIDRLYLYPIVIRRSGTLSSIATYITTAQASQVFGIGVYAHDWTTGRPTGNPIASTGFALSTAATTGVDGPLAVALDVSPGLYWIAFQTNATTALWQAPAATNTPNNYIMGDASINVVSAGVQAPLTGYTILNTFGSWPDVTSATYAFNQSNRIPAFLVKFSALT